MHKEEMRLSRFQKFGKAFVEGGLVVQGKETDHLKNRLLAFEISTTLEEQH
jgi:hypothetical protein